MENNNTNLQNQDYYSNKSKKIIDFIIGYFGFFVVILILFYCDSFVINAFPKASSLPNWITIILVIAIIIAANVTIKKKRKYIAKGTNFALLSLILIPVLLFGACFIMISGYK